MQDNERKKGIFGIFHQPMLSNHISEYKKKRRNQANLTSTYYSKKKFIYFLA